MPSRVKLSDIIEALETQSPESSAFLNKNTGRVMFLAGEKPRTADENDQTERSSEWQNCVLAVLNRIIEESGTSIPLPSKVEIDERGIMEEFCASVRDSKTRATLCSLIYSEDAPQQIENAIRECKIADAWYKFRHDALKEIAIKWCQENAIEFDDK
jgi:hypothetical protein